MSRFSAGRPHWQVRSRLWGAALKSAWPAAAPSYNLLLLSHLAADCRILSLCTIVAVLKHMQLEDGLLFLWRIADDATIITVRSPPLLRHRRCCATANVPPLFLVRSPLLGLLALRCQFSCAAPVAAGAAAQAAGAAAVAAAASTHHPLTQLLPPPSTPPQSVPEGSQGSEEARRWAEHPSIVASVLEPGPCRLKDCPLEASYGR